MPDEPTATARPATNRPGPRGPARRAAAPQKIPSGPPLAKFAPYIIAAVTVGVLALLVRTPRFEAIGSLAIGLVAMTLLAYVALMDRISLKPGDRLRAMLPATVALVLAATVPPFAYTLFPGAPRGTVVLRPGERGAVSVAGTASTVWLTVSGRFAPTPSGAASYFLSIARNSEAPQTVEGVFAPRAGGPAAVRHKLAARGVGTYTVTLLELGPALAPPLSVAVSAKPFATVWLAFLYAALAVLALAVDVMLWRRGVEPSAAAALLLPLVAVLWFQHKPVSDTVKMDLLTAGVVGAVVGGLGGELLARAARMLVKK